MKWGLSRGRIPRHARGAACALDALPQAASERFHAPAHFFLPKRGDAVGEKRLQVHPLMTVHRRTPIFPTPLPLWTLGGLDDLTCNCLRPRGIELLIAV